jgi:hypothetical protein
MSGPPGVPRQRTFDPTVSSPSERRAARRPAQRPAPRHRALAVALGTLAAPALAVLALTAFGAVGDEPEEGLGSLQAAEGLQGSATEAPAEPGGEKSAGQMREVREDERDSEFVDAEPEREGSEARRDPVPTGTGEVDGQLAPEPGAPTGPPVAGVPPQGTAPDEDDGGGGEPGEPGYSSP